jgi:DNA polymerase III epsilon subunit-like protein
MSRTLIFDTETTGLPIGGLDAEPAETYKWESCRLVQLAWELYDGSNLISQGCYIVKPDGWFVSDNASNLHGITNTIAY